MEVVISAHQPAYLPWLGYFDKMAQSDVFVILDDVQFERNSFINRNRIRVADKPHWLTIPLKMEGHLDKTIRQMEIDDSTFWKGKHWETIRHAYHRAPFWDETAEYLKDYLDYCAQSPLRLCAWPMEWCRSFAASRREYCVQSECGYTGTKQELVLNLCKHYGADKFLFGAQGRDYCDVEYFRANGVEPLFQDFKCPEYPQQGKGFITNLSVIDALFNVGIEGTRKLIGGIKLQ